MPGGIVIPPGFDYNIKNGNFAHDLQVPPETDSAFSLSEEETRMENFTISLAKLSERVNMEVVYTPRELNQINVEIAEVNRPGLFLAGYYEYFDNQ